MRRATILALIISLASNLLLAASAENLQAAIQEGGLNFMVRRIPAHCPNFGALVNSLNLENDINDIVLNRAIKGKTLLEYLNLFEDGEIIKIAESTNIQEESKEIIEELEPLLADINKEDLLRLAIFSRSYANNMLELVLRKISCMNQSEINLLSTIVNRQMSEFLQLANTTISTTSTHANIRKVRQSKQPDGKLLRSILMQMIALKHSLQELADINYQIIAEEEILVESLNSRYAKLDPINNLGKERTIDAVTGRKFKQQKIRNSCSPDKAFEEITQAFIPAGKIQKTSKDLYLKLHEARGLLIEVENTQVTRDTLSIISNQEKLNNHLASTSSDSCLSNDEKIDLLDLREEFSKQVLLGIELQYKLKTSQISEDFDQLLQRIWIQQNNIILRLSSLSSKLAQDLD